MLALKILGGILLFFVLLFSLRIKVFIRMEDELRIRAGLGPIILTVVPGKPKKPLSAKDFSYKKHQKRLLKDQKAALRKKTKRAAKKAAKAEKDRRKKEAKLLAEKAEAASKDQNESNAAEKIESILALVRFGFGELGNLISYVHSDVRKLEIVVGGSDAAQIALNYGRISAGAAILFELLEHKTALKNRPNREVSVSADFLAPKTVFHADMSFKLRLVSILRIGLHALSWFIRQKLETA